MPFTVPVMATSFTPSRVTSPVTDCRLTSSFKAVSVTLMVRSPVMSLVAVSLLVAIS